MTDSNVVLSTTLLYQEGDKCTFPVAFSFQMSFASDQLANGYLRTNMPTIVTKVKVRQIVVHLPCLTDYDRVRTLLRWLAPVCLSSNGGLLASCYLIRHRLRLGEAACGSSPQMFCSKYNRTDRHVCHVTCAGRRPSRPSGRRAATTTAWCCCWTA